MSRTSAVRCRRSPMASALQRPCLRAFLLPLPAPGALPPCIRQRPLAIAGDWQGVLVRVRAWQRGLRCMGNLLCMGLFLEFAGVPTPGLTGSGGNHPDHRLAAGMDVEVFDRDLLLALAAMAVEGFEQRRIGARQLVCLREVLAPALKGLVAAHGGTAA